METEIKASSALNAESLKSNKVNNMKKIVAFILAFSLIFCFTSCAKEKSENPANESTTADIEETIENKTAEKKNAIEFLSVYTEKSL